MIKIYSRKKQAKRKFESDINRREKDPIKAKKDQTQRKKLSRTKKKTEDPQNLRTFEKKAQRKKRQNWSDNDRLREFREDTKYNALFICNCCHRRLFIENVDVVDDKLIILINDKKTD